MKLAPSLQFIWQTIFHVISQIDPVIDAEGHPIWRISDGECKELANATNQYLSTINKNRQSALKKLIEKHMPLIALTATVGMAFQPRVVASLEAHKQRGNIRRPIAPAPPQVAQAPRRDVPGYSRPEQAPTGSRNVDPVATAFGL